MFLFALIVYINSELNRKVINYFRQIMTSNAVVSSDKKSRATPFNGAFLYFTDRSGAKNIFYLMITQVIIK